jgi:hypothetical protein
MLTDAQELLRDRDYSLASRKVRPPTDGIAVTFLDAARNLDENQKWSKYYRDTIISRPR